MYEVQAQLIEMKEELGKIKKENDELKNQIAVNNLMKTADDHAKLSETVGAMQVNFTTLSTKVSRNDKILSEINENLRKQNKTLMTHTEALNRSNEINKVLTDQNKEIQILKKEIKTTDNETVLLLGGRSGSRILDSLLILQNNGENNGNWKKLNINLPYPVFCHGAQFLNNYLYIFGGKDRDNKILNSGYKLKKGHKWLTKSLQWEKITDMNQKRDYISNSSVILNDRIWVIGGWTNGNGALKSVEREMNECRSVAAAAVANGKIFCCGGYNEDNFLKSAECYDPSSDVWTFISDMLEPSANCGIVVMESHFIVIGGKASKDKDFLNSVWVLDTTDKNAKWIKKKQCISRPLCKFSVAKINDKIFVCGGGYIDKEDSNHYVTDDVEIFDGEVWRDGPNLPVSQDYAAAVAIPIEFVRHLK